MTYPWPKAPAQDGTGTTVQDLQRIVGAQYSTSGILPTGGVTVTGTSSMAYKVTAGAVILKTAAGLGTLYPIEEQTVNTVPAPSTGSRQDRVVMDRDGAVRVVQGAAPAGGITLGLFTVLAGITSTLAAQQSMDRNFAIPAGASLGRLHAFHDPANGVFGNVSPMTLGSGRLPVLPSDRLVRFDLTHCISAEQDANPATGEATVMRWRVYIDNVLEVAFTTRAEWDNPQTNFFSFTKPLSEGAHTVHYIQDRLKGARFMHHKGTAAAYAGNRFEVWDAGVAR